MAYWQNKNYKCPSGYYLDGTVSWTCDKGNWVLQSYTDTCTSNGNCECIKSCDSDNILLVAGSQKIDNASNKLGLISGTLFKNKREIARSLFLIQTSGHNWYVQHLMVVPISLFYFF